MWSNLHESCSYLIGCPEAKISVNSENPKSGIIKHGRSPGYAHQCSYLTSLYVHINKMGHGKIYSASGESQIIQHPGWCVLLLWPSGRFHQGPRKALCGWAELNGSGDIFCQPIPQWLRGWHLLATQATWLMPLPDHLVGATHTWCWELLLYLIKLWKKPWKERDTTAYIQFAPFSDLTHPQNLHFAFCRLPSDEHRKGSMGWAGQEWKL